MTLGERIRSWDIPAGTTGISIAGEDGSVYLNICPLNPTFNAIKMTPEVARQVGAELIRSADDARTKDCVPCKGRGKRYVVSPHTTDIYSAQCDHCGGTGRVPHDVEVSHA